MIPLIVFKVFMIMTIWHLNKIIIVILIISKSIEKAIKPTYINMTLNQNKMRYQRINNVLK